MANHSGFRRAILLFATFISACSDGGRGSEGKSAERQPIVETTSAAYETCADAIADGAAPLEEGDAGYSEELDSDGDGVACENYSHDRDFEAVGDTSSCTDDCSGHDAGFDWARDHDITDESECGGYSQSFIEGCQAYVETL